MQPFAADFRLALDGQRATISEAALRCAAQRLNAGRPQRAAAPATRTQRESGSATPPVAQAAAGDQPSNNLPAYLDELLDYLTQAIALGRPQLFGDYLAWLKIVVARRNEPAHLIATLTRCLDTALVASLPPDYREPARGYIAGGLAQLPNLPSDLPSLLAGSAPFDDLTSRYLSALLGYNRQAASQLIREALDGGMTIKDIYLHVFQRSQRELGRLWQLNQISVGQEHFCTAATQLIMAQLYPQVFTTPRIGRRMLATSVAGNLHEFGIRMVADFFELDGWDTIYLGANLPLESVLKTLLEQESELVAISATSAPDIPKVIDMIRAIGALPLDRGPQILVGGPPFNAIGDLWRQVGANGFASDAQEAVATALRLVQNAGDHDAA